jgi:hypothetical protein
VPDGHYDEARDQAQLARVALQFDLARRIALGEMAADQVDWSEFDIEEQSRVMLFVGWEVARLTEQRRRRSGANRRAYKLLHSLLTEPQSAMLRRNGDFLTRGSAGGIYRLFPRLSAVWRVELHGSRYFWRAHACLHEHGEQVMPPADVTIGHLLWIRADEPGFIEAANWTVNTMLWNGEWLRRLRLARLEREREAEEARNLVLHRELEAA